MSEAGKIRPIRGALVTDPAGAAIQELRHLAPLELTLEPIEVLMLLSNLQLSLRHPDNIGPSNALARDIAARLQAHLQGPNLRIVAQLGWDASFDVERKPS